MIMKNRKAISPVIATVILVAVAITIAVAVSYWMSGISSSYTKFEKVEIQTAVCSACDATNGWTVTLTLKNSGTSAATISNVFINDQIAQVGVATTDITLTEIGTDVTSSGTTIASGSSDSIEIYVGPTFSSSGTSINIKLHSAGGMDYIKLVELV